MVPTKGGRSSLIWDKADLAISWRWWPSEYNGLLFNSHVVIESRLQKWYTGFSRYKPVLGGRCCILYSKCAESRQTCVWRPVWDSLTSYAHQRKITDVIPPCFFLVLLYKTEENVSKVYHLKGDQGLSNNVEICFVEIPPWDVHPTECFDCKIVF